MKDREEKFRKRKGEFFSEGVRPKKSYSENGASSEKEKKGTKRIKKM